MTYPQAIQFLYGLRLFGAKFGLENTFKLAALAGEPQRKLRFIHVAGTNGKGSTCAMLESVYRATGLRVGLFTSPHLVSFRERIQIGRQLISENDVVRLVEKLQAALPQFPKDHHPTFFEVVTVMALEFFAEHSCDLVIWETGLGGRLDATNIVTPLACVITNIALDHQQWLGDTLDKIAFEKAGIIKPGVPVATAADEPEALAVIKSIAKERNAPLKVIGKFPVPFRTSSRIMNLIPSRDVSNYLPNIPPLPGERAGVRAGSLAQPDYSLEVHGKENTARCPRLSLPGEHQKRNAALALATVDILQEQIPVSAPQIEAGLKNVQWPGRLQLIGKPDGRKILLDGAHNAAGAKVLRDAIEHDFPTGKKTLILGILDDKNWREICETLAPLAREILAVPVSTPRTANPAELAQACQTSNPSAKISVCDSLNEALQKISTSQFVIVAGSLYLVGEALELLGCFPSAAKERELNEWKS